MTSGRHRLTRAAKILVRFALQIDQANGVTSAPRGSSNKFKTERFETKIDLRVHQAAGMNREEFHLFNTSVGLLDPSKSNSDSRNSEENRYLFV
jgi:hypothetical protein